MGSRGEALAYKSGRDDRRTLWVKPLKEIDLDVAQAFFWPLKETMLKQANEKYSEF